MQKYQVSGLSQQAFCMKQGLAISSFCKWRHKLASSDESSLADNPDNLFVEIAAIDDDAQPTLQWDVELALSNGMVLRLRQN